MCFSDSRFAYGPFAPHHIPRQYIENYFAIHKTDSLLALNTTLEDLSQVARSERADGTRWKLTLRKYDPARHVDVWWEEFFDAVVLATGHYSVPFVRAPLGQEDSVQRCEMLTASPGPPSRWSRSVCPEIPWAGYPLQVLPLPPGLLVQESRLNRQLVVGPRCQHRPDLRRAAPSIRVPAVQVEVGRRRAPSGGGVETHHPRVPSPRQDHL